MTALEARRRLLMMQEVIPAGYKRIQYAEAIDGTTGQINLPIGFYPTDEVEVYGAISKIGNDRFLIAARNWNNNVNRYALFGTVSSRWTAGYGGINTGDAYVIFSPVITPDKLFHKFAYKNYRFYSEDIGIETADLSTVQFNAETSGINLFYGYNVSTPGKIAYYRHKKANGTVLNVIPIRHKVTGVVEMYDTVSRTIMPRTGTLYAPE